jgi:GNAT superfamily N-acetyltransferase
VSDYGDIAVRPAEAGDAEAIAILCGQLGYPSTAEQIERRLAEIADDPGAVVLVADSGAHVIAWVHVRALPLLTRDACAEIGGLVVDESRRGHGIGGRLMAAAEEWARGRGLDTLRLRSNVIRDDAHTFYRRQGFASSKTSLLFTKPL